MKKKGFTLIELLAVIIILGVVALIVTPIVINLTSKAKDKGATVSTQNYIKALEEHILFKNYQLENDKYDIKDSLFEDMDIKGEIPTKGYVIIEDNYVIRARICIDSKGVEYNNNKTKIISEDCNFDEEVYKHIFTDNRNPKEDIKKPVQSTKMDNMEQTLTYKIANDINEKMNQINSNREECELKDDKYVGDCYYNGDRKKITNNKLLYTGLIWEIMGLTEDGDLILISEQPLVSLPWGTTTSYTGSNIDLWMKNYFIKTLKGTDLENHIKEIRIPTLEELGKYGASAAWDGSYTLGDTYINSRTSMWLKEGYYVTDTGVIDKNKTSKNQYSTWNPNIKQVHGVRPVIVISNEYVSGKGTFDSMYKIISNNKEITLNNLNTGDCLKIDNDITVRLIEKDSLKVSYNGILVLNNAKFQTNDNFALKTNVYKGSMLESAVINWMNSNKKLSSFIDKTPHKFDITPFDVDNFKMGQNFYEGIIALPSIGELFSGGDTFTQIYNYVESTNSGDTGYIKGINNQQNNQYFLNPGTGTTDYNILGYNGFEVVKEYGSYGVRPVFHLRNDLKIISGDGSMKNPYVLSE